jgi:hypothetical protein
MLHGVRTLRLRHRGHRCAVWCWPDRVRGPGRQQPLGSAFHRCCCHSDRLCDRPYLMVQRGVAASLQRFVGSSPSEKESPTSSQPSCHSMYGNRRPRLVVRRCTPQRSRRDGLRNCEKGCPDEESTVSALEGTGEASIEIARSRRQATRGRSECSESFVNRQGSGRLLPPRSLRREYNRE